MIYEFKSRTHGTLVMTDDIGTAVLEAIGRTKSAQGVIQVADMPAAIATLKRLMSQNRPTGKDDDEGEPIVSFAQRALPFVEMLEACVAAKSDVTWGV